MTLALLVQDMYVRCPVQFVVKLNNQVFVFLHDMVKSWMFTCAVCGAFHLNAGVDVQVRCRWWRLFPSGTRPILEGTGEVKKHTLCYQCSPGVTVTCAAGRWQRDQQVVNQSRRWLDLSSVVCCDEAPKYNQHIRGSLLIGKCPHEKNWVIQYKNNNNNNPS